MLDPEWFMMCINDLGKGLNGLKFILFIFYYLGTILRDSQDMVYRNK